MLSSRSYKGSLFWKGICWISTDCFFVTLSKIASSGEDNTIPLGICVLYSFMSYSSSVVFSCCIKSTSFSKTAFFGIFLEAFLSFYKEESFLWFGKQGLIKFLVICLCLISKYLSISKLNRMLIFLLILLIFSLHKWYCPIRLLIVLYFHGYFIIKVIYHHSYHSFSISCFASSVPTS